MFSLLWSNGPELRCHILKEDFSYVDYQFAASPSKSGVSFRVRDEDPVKYYGKMVKFFPPKDSVLYNLYMVHLGDNRPLTLAEIYNLDFAVICTANKNYPFIICREFVLQEGLTT